MKYDLLQGVGAIVMVVSAQAAIRMLFDHDDHGLLAWLPGGFAVVLVAYVALLGAGVLLGGWAHGHAKALGRRERG
ncbi:hypothetical protein [Streptomyces sp. UNOC14_S4]|uniref:hypothetical protein n=1 Tax=Streptomyces sp. UNOC14_S4 TaxID=2872340 RepID=UPI001E5E2812|nr:hypothetical protein [Streptomyces sp. UNOC14_S4]MCC3771203.1 hypothetical protein [Streptomyces sp. UNOC14_S4]